MACQVMAQLTMAPHLKGLVASVISSHAKTGPGFPSAREELRFPIAMGL